MITVTTIAGETLSFAYPPEALPAFRYFFGRTPEQFCNEAEAGHIRSDHVALLFHVCLMGAGATAAVAEAKCEASLRHDADPSKDPRQVLAARIVREAMAA